MKKRPLSPKFCGKIPAERFTPDGFSGKNGFLLPPFVKKRKKPKKGLDIFRKIMYNSFVSYFHETKGGSLSL